MRYVYELLTNVERLAEADIDNDVLLMLLNERAAGVLSAAVEAVEKRFAQDVVVVSHAQVVVGHRLVTTLLIRRPAASVDPRRN